MGEGRPLIIRQRRGLPVAQAMAEMQAFVDEATDQTPEEIWCVEHPATFTLGLAADRRHLLADSPIPVIQTDRGGEITFHGPGQLVLYPLIQLRRHNLFVRELVRLLESSVISFLEQHGLPGACTHPQAPGVYLPLPQAGGAARHLAAPTHHPSDGLAGPQAAGLGKVAALGLKIRKGWSTHGLALNLAMDLSPFQQINPCGYAGLVTLDLATMGLPLSWEEASDPLCQIIIQSLPSPSSPPQG